eukprot:m.243094 g.243094  ORF g.243094 m.243094 type:complete len:517 (-) comp33806_c7_seq8:501-2051(-)
MSAKSRKTLGTPSPSINRKKKGLLPNIHSPNTKKRLAKKSLKEQIDNPKMEAVATEAIDGGMVQKNKVTHLKAKPPKSLLMTRSQLKTPPSHMRISLHPKSFGTLRPINSIPSKPPSKEEKIKQEEALKAETEFREQLEKISLQEKARKQKEIQEYKQIAIALEKKITDRVYAMAWLGKTIRSRYEGPYSVPETLDDVMLLDTNNGFKSPRSAAAMFLLVLCRRLLKPKKANALLLKVLHPDCLQRSDASQKEAPLDMIRKHTFKVLHNFTKDCMASYVVGTTPENNYAFDDTAVKFEVDNLTTTKVYENTHGYVATVYMVTTGAPPYHPRSRAVEVKNHHGKWYVRKFVKLAAPVVPGKVPVFGDNDSTTDSYVVPDAGIMGLHKPVDLYATLNKRKRIDAAKTRSMVDKEELALQDERDKLARQELAKQKTETFAEALVAREFLDRIANESPDVQHKFVGADLVTRIVDEDLVHTLEQKAVPKAKPKKDVEPVTCYEPSQPGLLPSASNSPHPK